MQPIDLDIRNSILTEVNNVVVSASAGTGKTHTTVERINIDITNNADFRTFAAITFTRKAAKEILNRIGNNYNNGFVGTNDHFVLTEIIQPFMKDVYGKEFKKDIFPDYSTDNAFDTFNDGIEGIKITSKICKYKNRYKNFSFELALNILSNSKAAREYLSSKYFRIFIDEYQDCDKDMHQLFMYICNIMKIPLFIVGDVKQSIYGWRGGYVDGFKKIINGEYNNYTIYKLKHNFRSNIAIQNYSNLFMEDVIENCKETTLNGEVIGYAYKDESYALEYINNWINTEKNCAFLVRSNSGGKAWSDRLRKSGLDFTYIYPSPLDYTDMESEHIWISRLIANFMIQERYTEYHFIDEIPTTYSSEFREIKPILISLKKKISLQNEFYDSCMDLYRYFGFDENDKVKKEITCLYQVINDEKFIPTYNVDKYSHIITTIHASKGLEFDQVIIQASDYDLSNEDDLYLHYVAVSRPKERLLVIIQDNCAKSYIRNITTNIAKAQTLGININRNDIIQGINSPEYVVNN